MVEIKLAFDNLDAVVELIKQYHLELGVDLSFQNYDEEIQDLTKKYGLPYGRVYLAYVDGKAVGCIALYRMNEYMCEMKRFFVLKEYRQLGIGNQLVYKLISEAKSIGYTAMLLDTLSTLESAMHLYKRFGFKEISAYYDNPLDNVVYLDLDLNVELFDEVDEEGNPTGKIVERTYAHEHGILHATSHVWVYRYNNQDIEVLLQKRSDDKDSYPGYYDISSAGHIQTKDSYETSAIRELKEELGVRKQVSDLTYLGRMRTSSKNIFHGKEFLNEQVSNVYMIEVNQDTFDYQKEEIQSVIWMKLEDMIDGFNHHTYLNCLKKEEVELIKKALLK